MSNGFRQIVACGDPTGYTVLGYPDLFLFFAASSLNSQGSTAFWTESGLISVRQGVVYHYDSIWLDSNGNKIRIVRGDENNSTPCIDFKDCQGDPTPIGGRFDDVSLPLLNNVDEVAFHATVRDGRARSGIFLASGGSIRVIAAQGDPTPIGGHFRTFSSFYLNDVGEVAFVAGVQGGKAPSGIFRYTEGQIQKVVAVGDAVSENGGIFESLSIFGLNNNSEVTFQSRVQCGAPPQRYSAAFMTSRGSFKQVMAVGDPAPNGGRFTLGIPAIANNEDFVAFHGRAEGIQSIFLAVSQDGGRNGNQPNPRRLRRNFCFVNQDNTPNIASTISKTNFIQRLPTGIDTNDIVMKRSVLISSQRETTGIEFENIPPSTMITVLNRKGEILLEYESDSPHEQWDGKDSHGREVPSGVYLIRFKRSNGSVNDEKVVVIR